MSFTELAFPLFVIIALISVSCTKNCGPRVRIRTLLMLSYAFYCWHTPYYLFLLLFSTFVDFTAAIKLSETQRDQRKVWLLVSLISNLSLLAFFKYGGLWEQTWLALQNLATGSSREATWNLILPIGISFYTFQSLSYTIDVYRKEIKPTRDFYRFALFVAFFPQLVAGPILRAKEFFDRLDQAKSNKQKEFNQRAVYYLTLGFFKKLVLADTLAVFVDPVFAQPDTASFTLRLLALYAYSFQIYLDFSGYSNIAEGLANLFGIRLIQNFNAPYTSISIRDFWKRWHMTFSRFLRDYLYLPLGGSRNGTVKTFIALATTMILGGLWHGAAWTFALWGAYHGLLLIIHRTFENRLRINNFFSLLLTFHAVTLGWLIFRAPNLKAASSFFGTSGQQSGGNALYFIVPLLLFCAWFHFWERIHETTETFNHTKTNAHWMTAIAQVLILCAWFSGLDSPPPFIYFQF